MSDPLLLSRGRLASFLACRRQFQLRYLEQLSWPDMPLREVDEVRLGQGQQFHQLLERHYLGLPVNAAAIPDRQVRAWWQVFQNNKPVLPPGRLLPELTLTIPIGQHLLHGRFDLLIIGKDDDKPFAHIVDWKTGLPQTELELRHDWQTRLYLAMLAEGGEALGDEVMRGGVPPEQIGITYWYVAEPDEPRTIQYNQGWHERNWAELEAVVAQIEAQLAEADTWPLTDDWTLCRTCTYQSYCGRQEAGKPEPNAAEVAAMDIAEWGETEYFEETTLEPESP